jgi:uracil-DNA glycosylase
MQININEITNEEKLRTLEEIKTVCGQCKKCELHINRTKSVFSDGNPNAKIMLIGEAPGAQEDMTGKPFVGRAGQLLDKILLSQNITREEKIYICNTVKCRPPENRVPTPEEKEHCRPYLDSQIQLIRPKIILLCGATAVQSMMTTKEGISKIRGKWFDGPFGSKMMPIFHPSYLLRNQSREKGSPRWLMWQDIQEIKKAADQV